MFDETQTSFYFICCKHIYLTTCQPVNLTTCRPVNLSTCQLVVLSTFQSVYLSTCLPVNRSTYQSVELSTYGPCNLLICQPSNLSSFRPVDLSPSQSFIHREGFSCLSDSASQNMNSNSTIPIVSYFIYLLIYLLISNIIGYEYQISAPISQNYFLCILELTRYALCLVLYPSCTDRSSCVELRLTKRFELLKTASETNGS